VSEGSPPETSGEIELHIDGVGPGVRVGHGGFGTVYRAFQPAYRRTVAVKLLGVTLTDDESRRAFDRECQALGSLSSHPNIVTLFEAGVSRAGVPYLIMDYLPGGSLAVRIRSSGPLGLDEALATGVKLAGAVSTAHEGGVLHRDIKPENVLVSEFGEPQLADFGVARLQGGTRTVTGSVTGSLAHAAPEVLSGVSATEASDVWSLASTLATLIAGSPPFHRDGEQSLHPMITRILTAPPADLRTRGVPDVVCRAIEAGLAKDSWERPSSARAFGEMLQQAQRAVGLTVTPMVTRRAADGAGVEIETWPPPARRDATADGSPADEVPADLARADVAPPTAAEPSLEDAAAAAATGLAATAPDAALEATSASAPPLRRPGESAPRTPPLPPREPSVPAAVVSDQTSAAPEGAVEHTAADQTTGTGAVEHPMADETTGTEPGDGGSSTGLERGGPEGEDATVRRTPVPVVPPSAPAESGAGNGRAPGRSRLSDDAGSPPARPDVSRVPEAVVPPSPGPAMQPPPPVARETSVAGAASPGPPAPPPERRRRVAATASDKLRSTWVRVALVAFIATIAVVIAVVALGGSGRPVRVQTVNHKAVTPPVTGQAPVSASRATASTVASGTGASSTTASPAPTTTATPPTGPSLSVPPVTVPNRGTTRATPPPAPVTSSAPPPPPTTSAPPTTCPPVVRTCNPFP
jgi:serine/threonine protein kinase